MAVISKELEQRILSLYTDPTFSGMFLEITIFFCELK